MSRSSSVLHGPERHPLPTRLARRARGQPCRTNAVHSQHSAGKARVDAVSGTAASEQRGAFGSNKRCDVAKAV